MSQALENLRKIWTPNKEIEEMGADLAPQTALDSQIRDLFHKIVQQNGPMPIQVLADQLNTGTLRWETVEQAGKRTVTIWVEE